ncbi:hypothetical protein QE152_g9821 [Popillia japonica]|uniref:Uncharacterized protein n=1 Tax=Popillia japonica TaxID=7064 RepID=A0AAW1LX92_POPJA
MQNKSKLRNRPGNKVFIEDDLTREERIIRQRAKEEKNKGKQVKIGLLKLGPNERRKDNKTKSKRRKEQRKTGENRIIETCGGRPEEKT